jgi:arylsulfatase A-like enzyme
MLRRFLSIVTLPAALLAVQLATAFAEDQPASPRKPINLLFIITDQQRWDTLGCMGNPVIHTPNIDKLAREGARFTNAYSSCPVCVPARTAILTGHCIESNRVTNNEEVETADLPDFLTFDQILLRNGYHGEYHGKYHSPYKYALNYTQPVRWLNGKKAPAGCKADMSESQAFVKYIDEHVPARPLQPGEQLANMYNRPYRPDPLDGASKLTPEEVAKMGKDRVAMTAAQVGQGFSYGCLDVPPEYTHAAYTVKEGLEALDRLKDGPFTLTVSISPPHPPMVLPRPYYGMYPAEKLSVPASIGDPRTNSPYPPKRYGLDSYRDPNNVRQMKSDYYGLVTLDDDWIGQLLKRLDELGLSDHTLVVFTADHGEMLGDHGMMSKFVFYEGSVHIPLILRLPGVIPAGTVVKAPVAQLDYFSTILDYLGQPGHESEGRDLRPLIEGREGGKDRVAVSEWPSPAIPGYMVCDGRWKLMFGRAANARSLDALYDLQTDPEELNNLLGNNPEREKYRAEGERMKGLLVAWLEHLKSSHTEDVKARPVIK